MKNLHATEDENQPNGEPVQTKSDSQTQNIDEWVVKFQDEPGYDDGHEPEPRWWT